MLLLLAPLLIFTYFLNKEIKKNTKVYRETSNKWTLFTKSVLAYIPIFLLLVVFAVNAEGGSYAPFWIWALVSIAASFLGATISIRNSNLLKEIGLVCLNISYLNFLALFFLQPMAVHLVSKI